MEGFASRFNDTASFIWNNLPQITIQVMYITVTVALVLAVVLFIPTLLSFVGFALQRAERQRMLLVFRIVKLVIAVPFWIAFQVCFFWALTKNASTGVTIALISAVIYFIVNVLFYKWAKDSPTIHEANDMPNILKAWWHYLSKV